MAVVVQSNGGDPSFPTADNDAVQPLEWSRAMGCESGDFYQETAWPEVPQPFWTACAGARIFTLSDRFAATRQDAEQRIEISLTATAPQDGEPTIRRGRPGDDSTRLSNSLKKGDFSDI